MRIAIDARKAYDGGIGRYIRGLSSGLLEADPALELTLLMPGAMPSFVPAQPRVARVDHGAGLYSLAELTVTASRVSAGGECDVFHEPHYVLPYRVAPPSVVTIHDVIHLRFPEHLAGPMQRLYARFMLRSAARRAAFVLTVSEHAKRDIVRETGVDPSRVRVTPPGVDARFVDPPRASGIAARERLGLHGPFVLAVGALRAHKNPIGLCRAFLRSLPADATLVFAGAGPIDVARWAREHGAAGRVRVVRADDDTLEGLYREARVFAMPSLYEGFGLPLLEAMAAGTAAVATNAASLPEVGGDAPRYVPPGDAAALGDALAALWSDGSERRTRVSAGRSRAEAFTWARTANLTLEVYEEAARMGSRVRGGPLNRTGSARA